MQLVFIADVHGNLPALRAVLSEVGGMRVFCVGDLVGYNPWPEEVVETARKKNFTCVLGNHDEAVLSGALGNFNLMAAEAILWTRERLSGQSLTYLSSLPKTLLLKEEDLLMVHGSPRNPLEEYVYPDHPHMQLLLEDARAQTLALAHTHVPFVREFDSGLVFNPGSVGQPRDGDSHAAYAVYDTESRKVLLRRIEYDLDSVRDKIAEEDLPAELAERLYLGF
jgi:putative phosphoesterase